MNRPEISIRPARPSRDEGVHFARYMNLAAEGGFRKMFGRRFEEIVSSAYLEPNHDLSYETALFAEASDQIVGMISGYTAEQYRGFDKSVVDRLAGRSRLRISLIYAMIAPMMRFLHTYNDGDFYVEFLSVDDTFRGQGIGYRLLAAMEACGQKSGSSHFAIDVARKNDGARRLYERYGVVAHDYWPRTRLMRPTVLRLTKPLLESEIQFSE